MQHLYYETINEEQSAQEAVINFANLPDYNKILLNLTNPAQQRPIC